MYDGDPASEASEEPGEPGLSVGSNAMGTSSTGSQHSSRVEASDPTQGSTRVVRPGKDLKPDLPRPMSPQEAAVVEQADSMMRVLFVDSDPEVRRDFVHGLAAPDVEIHTFAVGREALRHAMRTRFSVVVTGPEAGGIPGAELLRQMDFIQPDLGAVWVSNDADLRDERRIDHRIVASVRVPWTRSELRAAVRRAHQYHLLHQGHVPSETEEAPMSDRESRTVLHVEDEPADALLLRRPLERMGWQVTHVETLEAALNALRARRFAVVLSDLSLPDARGLDAVAALLEAAPNTAVVVHSGYPDPTMERQTLRLGAQEYVVKGTMDSGTLIRLLVHARERKWAERRLSRLAHRDPLTGLHNRRSFMSGLQRVIARSARRQSRAGVLLVDLDHFKTVNDVLGHEAGDQLLQQVADVLRTSVRASDWVGRLGGDEFAVVLDDLEGPRVAAEVAQRIVDEVAALADTLSHGTVHATASVGLAQFPDDGVTADELLQNADAAMYAAKARGRNGFVAHGPVAGPIHGLAPTTLLAQMEQGLANGDFGFAYQPQYRIVDGTLVGFEALLRWHRSTSDGVRETVLPGAFLEVAEQTGFVTELGRAAVDQVIGALARSGRPGLRVALNFSPSQFEQPDLVERIAGALSRHAVAPDALEIEITENLFLVDSDRTRRALAELKELGVRLAIDDFGTGYASLSYLNRIAADVLKVDRSLVAMLGHTSGDAIAHAIVELGTRLGLEVVAEGVETRFQLQRLGRIGCPLAQGFLLGRPSAIADAPDVLPDAVRGRTPSSMERQVRPHARPLPGA